MIITTLMEKNKITAYKLSKITNIPYMTINDLINEKSSITKCNAETVYKIAQALNTTVETLLKPYITKRPSFEGFKSNVCHTLKEKGDLDFLIYVMDSDEITELYNMEWYPECFYLLAMFDYISRINDVPLCDDYNYIRKMRLSEIVYPSGILIKDYIYNSDEARKKAWEESIPEFKNYNIVENEVRNVV